MKILEVRDGFVKFEANNTICLSSFIQIKGQKSYIAQVTKLTKISQKPIAYAKILFLYDGQLQNYDNSQPTIDSEISEFTYDILNNSIMCQEPLIIGKTLGEQIPINIDLSAFNKKMLITVDNNEYNNLLARNLVKQFNNFAKKVIIIDTLGIINAKKYYAGVDFKLPLDTDSLEFMYKECLNDATSDSKSTIVDIFRDLSEYSKTIPFVPFATLKTIVDDMVDKSHVFKLLVLKNKLSKFDKLGYFANNKNDVEKIKTILNSNYVIIDVSKLDVIFQNKYISYIYKCINSSNIDTQILFELSNTVSKRTLKDIFVNENIATTFITHSKFKFINDIKNLFDNFIIFPSITNNNVFELYSNFLKEMSKDSYIITGEATNYIPLISTLNIINDVNIVQQIPTEEETQNNIINENVIQEESTCIQEENKEEEISNEQIELLTTTKNELVEIQEIEITPIDNKTNEENIFIEDSSILDDEENKIVSIDIEKDEESVITKEDIISNIDERSNSIIEEMKLESETKNIETIDIFEQESDSTDLNLDENSDIEQIAQPDETEIELAKEITNDVEEVTVEKDDIEEISNNIEQEIVLREIEEEIGEQIIEENIDSLNNNELEEIVETDNLIETNEIAEIETVTELELDLEDSNDSNIQENELLIEDENISNELIDNGTVVETDELESNEIVELPEELNNELDETEPIETLESENLSIDNSFDEFNDKTEVLPISNNDELGEIIELDSTNIQEDDIVVEIDDTPVESVEDIDEQIIKDVDKVFTTQKNDVISDTDLDFIDELNNEETMILEEIASEPLEDLEPDQTDIIESVNSEINLLEESSLEDEILEKKKSTTPMVPVYEAEIPEEDLVVSDPVQQGDLVTHAKYGTGIVEKMIKYGNKTLYSINFDNIGRRLLDPTLTEIKKA